MQTGVMILLAGLSAGPHAEINRPPDGLDAWVERYYGWLGAADIPASETLAAAAASARTGTAVAAYGTALLLEGKPEPAVPVLREAVRTLRQEGALYEERLIAPYFFLGVALREAGDHAEAIDMFSRARHVSHRLWGGNNVAEIPVVYAQARSMAALGEWYEAEELQRFAYKLHRETYGPRSPETVAAADRLGGWLRAMGYYKEALSHYRTVLKAFRHSDGGYDPEAVPLLIGKAKAYLGGPLLDRSIPFYRRALAVMDAHPDRFDLDQRIAARIGFADLLLRFSYERAATEQYVAAWEQAAGAENQRHWIERLEKPELVRFQTLVPGQREGDRLYFEFEFDLTHDGRPRDVAVRDSNADGADQYYAPRIFRSQVRFRPAIIDGAPVAMEDQRIVMSVGPARRDTPPVGRLFELRRKSTL